MIQIYMRLIAKEIFQIQTKLSFKPKVHTYTNLTAYDD